jgi:hypothetical protein
MKQKPVKVCLCPTKYCEHYESDFDRFVKEGKCSSCLAGFSREDIEGNCTCFNIDRPSGEETEE